MTVTKTVLKVDPDSEQELQALAHLHQQACETGLLPILDMTFGLPGFDDSDILSMKLAATEILLQLGYHTPSLVYELLNPESKLFNHLNQLFKAMHEGHFPDMRVIARSLELIGNLCMEENVFEFINKNTSLTKTVIIIGKKCDKDLLVLMVWLASILTGMIGVLT